MATYFSDIIDLAMLTIQDYKLDRLYAANPVSWQIYLNGFVVRAIPLFSNCSNSLDYTTSDSSATISIGISTGITGAILDLSAFETMISTTGTYEFTFDGTDWYYDSSIVLLATYGITADGTAINGDIITIDYIAGDYVFTEILTNEEINILANLVDLVWLKSIINNLSQITAKMTPSDAKTYSEAQNLKEKNDYYFKLREECDYLMNVYGYKQVSWSDWADGNFGA